MEVARLSGYQSYSVSRATRGGVADLSVDSKKAFTRGGRKLPGVPE